MPEAGLVFETPRLRARLAGPADEDLFRALWSDPRVMKYVGFPHGLRLGARELAARLEQAGETVLERLLVVVLKDSGQAVGECKLAMPDEQGIVEPDLKLLPAFWGQRLGVEAWLAIVDYQFRYTSCQAVQATPNIENLPSIKMQEAAGMQRVGEEVYHFPEAMQAFTQPVPHAIYRLERGEWERQQQARASIREQRAARSVGHRQG